MQQLLATESLSVPTLMVQGDADACDGPQESEGQQQYFTAGYRRLLLAGIGHFPHREAPE
ncbi:alpha/beta fold hydrolase [Hymenobacter wooponensis]|uniref:alpha/beta fold hydrolase n=1 Tax=Hymenobacter wooponensis TaxID=1525360 RepID=UPI001AEBEE90|nr:alpha/beta hydrolase [Hymenobacter wooponensis]